jgi:RHS repeat-associated protein
MGCYHLVCSAIPDSITCPGEPGYDGVDIKYTVLNGEECLFEKFKVNCIYLLCYDFNKMRYIEHKFCRDDKAYESLYAYYIASPYFKNAGEKDYELTNHLGNVLATLSDKKEGIDENLDGVVDYYLPDLTTAQCYYAFGSLMPGRNYSAGEKGYRFGFNGKEKDDEVKGEGNQQDYGMRIYDGRLGRFLSEDPLTKSYPSWSPYPFAMNRPIDGIDLDGCEWKRADGGFMWDPNNAYSDANRTVLKTGYYNQAVYFSDQGTFDKSKEFNMGTSIATVYKANGTTTNFNASIYPARSEKYATTPEGDYEGTIGLHHGDYNAIHVHDVGKTNSESIDLGAPNPSNPKLNTATGIHIHKAGINNKTGMTTDKKPISAGCLLIDINKWNKFIGLFDNNNQRNNDIGIHVSRSSNSARVEYCGDTGPKIFEDKVKDNDKSKSINVESNNSSPWH